MKTEGKKGTMRGKEGKKCEADGKEFKNMFQLREEMAFMHEDDQGENIGVTSTFVNLVVCVCVCVVGKNGAEVWQIWGEALCVEMGAK